MTKLGLGDLSTPYDEIVLPDNDLGKPGDAIPYDVAEQVTGEVDNKLRVYTRFKEDEVKDMIGINTIDSVSFESTLESELDQKEVLEIIKSIAKFYGLNYVEIFEDAQKQVYWETNFAMAMLIVIRTRLSPGEGYNDLNDIINSTISTPFPDMLEKLKVLNGNLEK